jgi:microcompartment protein CcmL/EutN
MLQEAFGSVEQAIHEKWADCPLRDREGAHELKLMLKLLGDVRAVLEAAVSDGKIAAQRLDELNSRRVLSPAQWSGR